MTEAQKEYIITEEQLMEATDNSCYISKMVLRDKVRSRPYKSSDKVICPQSSVCKPGNCTHRKPHLKSERCKENDDTKCDVCDECRSAKESSDAVLDELESKRARYEALLNDYTSCSDEFDRGLIEGKLVVCVILREWIVELQQQKER